jgi:hypothetical protein
MSSAIVNGTLLTHETRSLRVPDIEKFHEQGEAVKAFAIQNRLN